MTTEVYQKLPACKDDILSLISEESCVNDFNEMPSSYKRNLIKLPEYVLSKILKCIQMKRYDGRSRGFVKKLSTETEQICSACFKDSLSHISGESCVSDFNELSPDDKRKFVSNYDMSEHDDKGIWRFLVETSYKDQMKQTYYEYLKDDLVVFHTLAEKGSCESVSNNDYAIILYCNSVSNYTYLMI
ncbi:unnamed protein product [Mytilus edulis]|uniref:Uncharacterized protein n=1 Tax=Mytilus edulis TaxID=6550 RepID=A0A8S3V7B0_MYTED|nr:unnamed protein product [Mytilus edulis]